MCNIWIEIGQWFSEAVPVLITNIELSLRDNRGYINVKLTSGRTSLTMGNSPNQLSLPNFDFYYEVR